MTEEFSEDKINTIESNAGFVVELKFGGGIIFKDSRGSMAIDGEWLVNPRRMVVYSRKLDKFGSEYVSEVLDKVVRALRFKGIESEIDDLT